MNQGSFIDFKFGKCKVLGLGNISYLTDYEKIISNFNRESKIIFQNNLHSNVVTEIVDFTKTVCGDCVFTKKKNFALFTNCSDCLPIVGTSKEVIGVLHVSWKSLYLGLIEKSLSCFQKSAKIDDLFFFLGPCISYDNYKVSENFKKLFLEERKIVINGEKPKFNTCFKQKEKDNFFDLRGASKKILELYKIKEEKIMNCDIDTFSNKNLASYRRDGKTLFSNFIGVIIED